MSQQQAQAANDQHAWKIAEADDDLASEYTWATDNESTATGHTSRRPRRLVWPDGSVFEGPLNFAHRPEGQGELKASNGDEYRGGWLDGAMHGWGRYVMNLNGLYEGGVAKNRRHGKGHFKCINGLEYEGEWRDDRPHGSGRFSKASAGVYYQGEWRDGRAHGIGEFHAPQWGTYSGEWRNDKKHGEGRVVYIDGSEYAGDWSDDLAHGQGKYVWANGDTYEGQFHRGTMTGQGTIVTKREGSTYRGMWQNNLREGYGQLTFFDGAVYEGEWAGDRPHGRGVFISPRGVMFRGYWTDGLFDAVQSECDPRGVCTCVVEGNDYLELDSDGNVLSKTIHPVAPPGEAEAAQALPRYRFCDLSQLDATGNCCSETYESRVYPQRDGRPVNPLESGYVYRTTFGKEHLPTSRVVGETAEAETLFEQTTESPPPLLTTGASYTTQIPVHSAADYNPSGVDFGERTHTHHSSHCLCGPHCQSPITNIINTHHYCDGRSETGRHGTADQQGHRFAVPRNAESAPWELAQTRYPHAADATASHYAVPHMQESQTTANGAPNWVTKVENLNRRMPVITPLVGRADDWRGPEMKTMTYTNSNRDVSFKPATPQMSSTEIYEAQERSYIPAHTTTTFIPFENFPSNSSSTDQQHCHFQNAQPTRREFAAPPLIAPSLDRQTQSVETQALDQEQNTQTLEDTRVVTRKIPVPVEAELRAHFTLPQIRTTTRVVPYPVYAPRLVEVPIPIENLSESGIALCDSIGLQVEEIRNQRSSAGIDRVAENIYELLVAAQNVPGSHARPQAPQDLDRYLPADLSALDKRPPSKK